MSKRRVTDTRLIAKRLPALLAAGAKVFDQCGFHVTTVKDVAVEAGVSVGLIYQYVNDKQELLYLILDNVVSEYEAAVEDSRKGGLDTWQSLVAVLNGIAVVVESNSSAARIGYREAHYLSRSQLEDIKRRERTLAREIEHRIERCQRAGVLREVDVEMLAFASLIFVQSWAVSVWRFESRVSINTYIERGIALLYGHLLLKEEEKFASIFGHAG